MNDEYADTMFEAMATFDWICDLHSIGDVARNELWDFISKLIEKAY